MNNTLYAFQFDVRITSFSASTLALVASDREKVELLHHKLCHLSYKNMKVLYPTLQIPANHFYHHWTALPLISVFSFDGVQYILPESGKIAVRFAQHTFDVQRVYTRTSSQI